uniref:CaM-binding domain protein n=1 Tax=Euglena gracilis TaxID=3039 RepID=C5J0G8_EUGGR|nr:CaM-binding domain protein [Euglena gracilis]
MNSLHESPGPVLSEEFWCQFDESLQETLALVEGGTCCAGCFLELQHDCQLDTQSTSNIFSHQKHYLIAEEQSEAVHRTTDDIASFVSSIELLKANVRGADTSDEDVVEVTELDSIAGGDAPSGPTHQHLWATWKRELAHLRTMPLEELRTRFLAA